MYVRVWASAWTHHVFHQLAIYKPTQWRSYLHTQSGTSKPLECKLEWHEIENCEEDKEASCVYMYVSEPNLWAQSCVCVSLCWRICLLVLQMSAHVECDEVFVLIKSVYSCWFYSFCQKHACRLYQFIFSHTCMHNRLPANVYNVCMCFCLVNIDAKI